MPDMIGDHADHKPSSTPYQQQMSYENLPRISENVSVMTTEPPIHEQKRIRQSAIQRPRAIDKSGQST